MQKKIKEKAEVSHKVRTLLWLKITVPLLCAVILCLACLGVWYKIRQVKVEHLHSLVYSQIEKVCELTVIKYNYGSVVLPKKSALNGSIKAYSIVKFSGVIRLGISNLEEMQITVSPNGKMVDVLLPHAEILENAIVSEEVFDEKRSIFIPITTQEIFDEIKSEMERTEDALLHDGILDEADERIVLLVKAFLSANGVRESTVHFKRKSLLPVDLPFES